MGALGSGIGNAGPAPGSWPGAGSGSPVPMSACDQAGLWPSPLAFRRRSCSMRSWNVIGGLPLSVLPAGEFSSVCCTSAASSCRRRMRAVIGSSAAACLRCTRCRAASMVLAVLSDPMGPASPGGVAASRYTSGGKFGGDDDTEGHAAIRADGNSCRFADVQRDRFQLLGQNGIRISTEPGKIFVWRSSPLGLGSWNLSLRSDRSLREVPC